MGTLQHAVAESGEDSPELPDEKAAAVAEVLRFVEERKALFPGHLFLSEEYLPVSADIIKDRHGNEFVGITGGYIDAAIISQDRRTAELLDHKFGKVAVEKAETNLQGIAYALGLVNKFPSLEKIRVWFLLPHRDEILGAEFTKDQFPEMGLRVRTVVSRAIEAHKTPDNFESARPNQGACMWCANLGRCPKVAQIALNVGKKYSPLDIPANISTTVFTDPLEVSNGLKLAGIIKTWAEAYRTQATAKSIESDFIPTGYTLVSSAKRTVVDAKKFGDLAKSFLPEQDRHLVEALYDIPIGKVEKLISVAMPRGSKEAQVEAFGEAAMAAGVVKMGAPFAFLRQDNAKEKTC